MRLFRRRVVPGNTRVTTAVYTVPDRWGVQAAGLGVMTNTFSPAANGVHGPTPDMGGSSARGWMGDRGFGVNRWAGRTDYPLQTFGQSIVPVADPSARRLGIGAGVAGQPGLPNTGSQTGGLSSIAWLTYNPLGRTGLGG
jgi:hypothetical protein